MGEVDFHATADRPVGRKRPRLLRGGGWTRADGSQPRERRANVIRELLADAELRAMLRAELGPIVDGPLPDEALGMTLVQVATVTAGLVPPEALQRIAGNL